MPFPRIVPGHAATTTSAHLPHEGHHYGLRRSSSIPRYSQESGNVHPRDWEPAPQPQIQVEDDKGEAVDIGNEEDSSLKKGSSRDVSDDVQIKTDDDLVDEPQTDEGASGKPHRPAATRLRSAIYASRAAHRVAVTYGKTTTGVRRVVRPYKWRSNPNRPSRYAAEPGIDPLKPQPHLEGDAKWNRKIAVDVVEYGEERVEFMRYRNEELAGFLENPKPEWAKVRWINVNGISWDVIRMIALKYSLHPLAIEDTLHSSSRSKSEYYRQHLFVHAAVHNLVNNPSVAPIPDEAEDPVKKGLLQRMWSDLGSGGKKANGEARSIRSGSASRGPNDGGTPFESVDSPRSFFSSRSRSRSNHSPQIASSPRHRSMKYEPSRVEEGLVDPDVELASDGTATPPSYKGEMGVTEGYGASVLDLSQAAGARAHGDDDISSDYDVDRDVVRQMTKDYKVRIHVEKMSIFLLRDGTLITIFSHSGSSMLAPIFGRLQSPDTLLRSSADPSMLLQAILDLVVDESLAVVESFRKVLNMLEARTLLDPGMKTVRHLHVLSAELLLLKRTLTPLLGLVNGIRIHDADSSALQRTRTGDSSSTGFPSQPLVSAQAKVYLGDVLDHIDSVLSSLELFSDLARNLVDFSFNSMGFSTNETMRQLSIVTVVFLPLTFLTGYFGQNFVDFDAIQGSDSFFWKLAVPVTIGVAILVMFPAILRFFALTRKKAAAVRRRKQK